MKEKISKTEAKEKIDTFFIDIKSKNPEEIKKIKKLASRFKIKIGSRKKEYCQNCLSPYKELKIRIKNNFKIVECKNCGEKKKWKLV